MTLSKLLSLAVTMTTQQLLIEVHSRPSNLFLVDSTGKICTRTSKSTYQLASSANRTNQAINNRSDYLHLFPRRSNAGTQLQWILSQAYPKLRLDTMPLLCSSISFRKWSIMSLLSQPLMHLGLLS